MVSKVVTALELASKARWAMIVYAWEAMVSQELGSDKRDNVFSRVSYVAWMTTRFADPARLGPDASRDPFLRLKTPQVGGKEPV